MTYIQVNASSAEEEEEEEEMQRRSSACCQEPPCRARGRPARSARSGAPPAGRPPPTASPSKGKPKVSHHEYLGVLHDRKSDIVRVVTKIVNLGCARNTHQKLPSQVLMWKRRFAVVEAECAHDVELV